MTIIQNIQARRIIAEVAKQQGISVSECRSEMIEAIRAAWATTDPVTKDRQIQLVGEERVPTPEEFIYIIFEKTT
jgi:hypothetical protein